jgi:PIN domain nuclease of toxin-antitoxin system
LDETGIIKIISISEKDWIMNLALNWDNKDPADRVIVTLAKNLGAGIVTSDKRIRNFYKKCIW